MRRESSEEVAAAARRRLEQLGRELARTGPDVDPDVDPDEPGADGSVPLVRPAVLRAPGRHARGRLRHPSERAGAWASDWIADRAPAVSARLRPAHLPVLGALVAVVLVLLTWVAVRGHADAVPVARTEPAGPTTSSWPTPAAGSDAASPGGAATPTAGTTGGSATVVVDVAGKVLKPGVATLPAGSRVIDALTRAGGAQRGVDLSSLNLARVLVDGEQILVGTPTAAAVAPTPTGSAATSTPGGATVNLNTADLAGLESLPGVGPVTAQKILDWRNENGRFSSVDELLEVDGIGAKTLADLAPHVTL